MQKSFQKYNKLLLIQSYIFQQMMIVIRSKTTPAEGQESGLISSQNIIPAIGRTRSHEVDHRYSDSQDTKRVPSYLAKAIRQMGRDKREERQILSSTFVNLFRSKINQIVKEVDSCTICLTQMQRSRKYLSLCECEHNAQFCQPCLYRSVIFKVQTHEQVFCPHDGCQVLIDVQGDFFKQLPAQIQRKYIKIHQFYVTSNDPTKKQCPRQNCQGLLQATTQDDMICSSCSEQFCRKCLLSSHHGSCDEKLIQIFQKLHFRQCQNCKIIIQKDQGCNHMTCRCGYQFCYVCDERWSQPHHRNHDENGLLIISPVIIPPDSNRFIQPAQIQPAQIFPARRNRSPAAVALNQRQRGSSCPCPSVQYLLLALAYILLISILFVIWIFFTVLLVIILILVGMFYESLLFCREYNQLRCFLAFIFFPISMVIGVVRKFRKRFRKQFGSLWSTFFIACRELKGYTTE